MIHRVSEYPADHNTPSIFHLSWAVYLLIFSLKLSLETYFLILESLIGNNLSITLRDQFFLFSHKMHFEAVINARNSNMLHSVLFTMIAVMMGDRSWYFHKKPSRACKKLGKIETTTQYSCKKGKGWESRHQTRSESHLFQKHMHFIFHYGQTTSSPSC